MKKYSFYTLFLVFALWNGAHGQQVKAEGTATEVIKRKGYQLTVINKDRTFDLAHQARLIETFFEVYPKLAKEYNPKAAREVVFVIDPDYDGVAGASANQIVYSSRYLKSNPKDVDVVTHETMHVVQDYGNSVGPGWLTEGIADFARNKFGLDNAATNWFLPKFNPSHKYENGYGVVASFLVWVEQSTGKQVVKNLSAQLTGHSYTTESWKKLTGKTLDELWKSYAANSSK